MDEEPRGLVSGSRLSYLLLDPFKLRACRGVDDHDASRPDLHHHENVHHREERRRLSQEVDRKDLVSVVCDERSPSLTTSRLTAVHPVPADRTGGVTNTQLDRQLLGDSVLSPLRVLATDPANQGATSEHGTK